MGEIKLLDCTLRDGGYINDWKFGKDTIVGILDRLSMAEIDLIECGFITEKTVNENYSLFADASAIDAYIKQPSEKAMYVAMIAIGEKEINPEIICDAADTIIDGIRITFHPDEMKKAFEWANILKKKGYKVFIQHVGSANYDDELILDIIKKVNQLKPYAFYIVDTLGAMSENDMLHMLHIIDRNLDENVKLGYHSHNNLQLAFANAQRMMEFDAKRDVIIDCSVYGMGRGAGNLCTELMVDYMKKRYNKNYDTVPILEIVDNYLLPIYMQKRWGYTIEYFLASSLDCHPNYVSYLMDKQNIPVRVIRNMLEQIPKEKRVRFDAKAIGDIYNKYQNNYIDDKEEIIKLRNEFKGKEVLIIGSGKSVKTRNEKIRKYISKNKPKVIAINFVPPIKTDMVFVANQKRFEMIRDSLDMKNVICTSNINGDTGEGHVVNYATLLNSGDIVSDSSGMMLLKLLKRLKVSKVKIAGMDGFKKNYLENYCEKRFVHEEDNATLREKNKEMREQFKLIKKEISVEFITPSKYCE